MEENLNKLIYGGALIQGKSFIPSPDEALFLLSARRLHDLGMLYGIFDDELPDKEPNWNTIRKKYEIRTSKYLRREWNIRCWSAPKKAALGQICIYCRLTHEIRGLGADVNGVRLRKLAALLRIADSFHIHEGRCPVDLQDWLSDFNGNEVLIGDEDQNDHRSLSSWVHSVNFNSSSGLIVPSIIIPEPKDIGKETDEALPAFTLDYRPSVELLCDGLRGILKRVSPYICQCPNTAYSDIKPDIHEWEAFGDAEEYLIDMWPTLLPGVSCASQAAAMVALIIRNLVGQTEGNFENDIRVVLNKALTLHRYNFLVHKLNDHVNKRCWYWRRPTNSA